MSNEDAHNAGKLSRVVPSEELALNHELQEKIKYYDMMTFQISQCLKWASWTFVLETLPAFIFYVAMSPSCLHLSSASAFLVMICVSTALGFIQQNYASSVIMIQHMNYYGHRKMNEAPEENEQGRASGLVADNGETIPTAMRKAEVTIQPHGLLRAALGSIQQNYASSMIIIQHMNYYGHRKMNEAPEENDQGQVSGLVADDDETISTAMNKAEVTVQPYGLLRALQTTNQSNVLHIVVFLPVIYLTVHYILFFKVLFHARENKDQAIVESRLYIVLFSFSSLYIRWRQFTVANIVGDSGTHERSLWKNMALSLQMISGTIISVTILCSYIFLASTINPLLPTSPIFGNYGQVIFSSVLRNMILIYQHFHLMYFDCSKMEAMGMYMQTTLFCTSWIRYVISQENSSSQVMFITVLGFISELIERAFYSWRASYQPHSDKASSNWKSPANLSHMDYAAIKSVAQALSEYSAIFTTLLAFIMQHFVRLALDLPQTTSILAIIQIMAIQLGMEMFTDVCSLCIEHYFEINTIWVWAELRVYFVHILPDLARLLFSVLLVILVANNTV